MNLPTDEQLREQAHKTLMGNETIFGLVVAGLKSDRESLRLLMEAEQFYKDCMEFDKAAVFTDHLTTLRTRLGITE